MVPPNRTAHIGVMSGMNLPAQTSHSPAQFRVFVPNVRESVGERPKWPAMKSDVPLNTMLDSSSRLGLLKVFAVMKSPVKELYCATRMSRSPLQGR